MSPLRRSAPGGGDAGLAWRADQLQEALDSGGDQLDPGTVATARVVLERVRQRWALKGGRTVVSLAGATGSGKSSLFNVLVGDEVSTIGARRPTTATATAAIWGSEDAGPLLDWLGVPNRHRVPEVAGGAPLDGLVLIDLPDFDSRERSHRVEAERVLDRSDVFVWVTDPQKYADARLHEDYLSALQDHDTVMVVVLNQVDRLVDDEAVERVRADLHDLVLADGAGDVEVITTSARMGTGVDALRHRVAEVVEEHGAAEARLRGDLVATARRLRAGVADTEPEVGGVLDDELHRALSRAAGVPVVLEAVRRDFVRQSRAHAGWPFTRWAAGLRPDPLKRLRLGDDRAGESGITPGDVGAVLGRSSLPPPSPAARSAVQVATRQVAEQAGEALPPRWAEAVADAAAPGDATLADALDQAVMSTSLRTRRPLWWPVLRVVQLLLATTAVVGGVWLGVLAVLGYLQLPNEAPTWGVLPVPALMLVGGLVLGLLLAGLGRVAARSGARRRRAVVGRRMDEAVAAVATERVRRPVGEVLARHRQVRRQLDAAQA